MAKIQHDSSTQVMHRRGEITVNHEDIIEFLRSKNLLSADIIDDVIEITITTPRNKGGDELMIDDEMPISVCWRFEDNIPPSAEEVERLGKHIRQGTREDPGDMNEWEYLGLRWVVYDDVFIDEEIPD